MMGGGTCGEDDHKEAGAHCPEQRLCLLISFSPHPVENAQDLLSTNAAYRAARSAPPAPAPRRTDNLHIE